MTSTAVEPNAGIFSLTQIVYHPYFGYILHPDRHDVFKIPHANETFNYRTNNHGFRVDGSVYESDPECCDYPMRHVRDDTMVVAIFGGSVGVGLATIMQKTGYFEELLRGIPEFEHKNFKVLNFAISGYKQPQQLMTLSYYLLAQQHFDIVINIDGFNEVASSFTNDTKYNAEILYPAAQLWKALGNVLEAEHLPSLKSKYLEQEYHRIKSSEAYANAEVSCGTATCFTLYRLIHHHHASKAMVGLDKDPNFEFHRMSRFLDKFSVPKEAEIVDLYGYVADTWYAASIAMNELSGLLGNALYIHVLQPNQWIVESGNYIPRDEEHPYKEFIGPVRQGYRRMLERSSDFNDRGVHFLDAARLFPDINDGFYIDDCCHYTLKGNKYIMERIAEYVADIVGDCREHGEDNYSVCQPEKVRGAGRKTVH